MSAGKESIVLITLLQDWKIKTKSKTTLTSLTCLFRSRTANLAFTRLESLFLNVSGITRG